MSSFWDINRGTVRNLTAAENRGLQKRKTLSLKIPHPWFQDTGDTRLKGFSEFLKSHKYFTFSKAQITFSYETRELPHLAGVKISKQEEKLLSSKNVAGTGSQKKKLQKQKRTSEKSRNNSCKQQ